MAKPIRSAPRSIKKKTNLPKKKNVNLDHVPNVNEKKTIRKRRVAKWLLCGVGSLISLLVIAGVVTAVVVKGNSEPSSPSSTAALSLNTNQSSTTTATIVTTLLVSNNTSLTTIPSTTGSTSTPLSTSSSASTVLTNNSVTTTQYTTSVSPSISSQTSTLPVQISTSQTSTITTETTTSIVSITTVTTCIPGLTWNSNGITVAGVTGVKGSSSSLFSFTNDVAVDMYNNIYIVDTDNHRIQRFAPNSSVGQTVAGISGSVGSGSNQFNHPRAIYITDNILFVSDIYNYRIQRYSYNAPSGTTVAGGNSVGANLNQINVCYGIHVDANGNIYYSDYYNHRIMRKSTTSSNGVVIAGNNGAGSSLNQFNLPMGIFIDVNNESILYIADSENHRIQLWIIGITTGTTVAGGNGKGIGLNQFDTPRSVIGDSNGNLYISDTNNHRIIMWSKGSSIGTVITGTSGSSGSSSTMLNYPNGIRFDADKNLYVADSNNFRIQKYLVCPIPKTSSTTISTTTTTTATAVPPCAPQVISGNILYDVTDPTSTTYPNYKCHAYIWTATRSSATLSFFFRHDPGGWLLDDIKVYHGLTQLISNGGFESGNLNSWTRTGTCNVYEGEAYFDSSYAKSGDYYYYDRCANHGDKISQTFSTIPGDIYVISFWLTNYRCCNAKTVIANVTIT